MFSVTKFQYGDQKSETVKKLEALNNGKIIVPKWLIVVGGFILFFLVVLFVLSIIFATIKKPNGLFNESCAKRICEKKLGLVCKNQICSCPEKQFYSDRCQNLSTHGQFCFIDENCRQKEESLVCSVVSRCECTSEMYWDSYLKKCVPRKSYKENCIGDQCKTSLNLDCNSGSCTCQNSSIQYWNGKSCLPKKSIKEYCSETYECLDSENTECKNSLCKNYLNLIISFTKKFKADLAYKASILVPKCFTLNLRTVKLNKSADDQRRKKISKSKNLKKFSFKKRLKLVNYLNRFNQRQLETQLKTALSFSKDSKHKRFK
ncbi:zonadhesin isoform X2 [Brachionus plicatilis]|uniref:Zonadhesin isoform X2 n=1 Tax=Brachionus plicatilis TaxID=10195 RepID=A0A3M7R210_BRAPC|nr:zonadhesin isoform X2 [Brachionus plicatilis]